MPATALEKTRIRKMTATDATSASDSYLDDDVFAAAEAEYPDGDYSRSTQFYAAALRVVQDLMMAATADVDYTEGDASQKNSQRFKALGMMAARFQKKLDASIDDDLPAANWLPFGGTVTYREEPDG